MLELSPEQIDLLFSTQRDWSTDDTYLADLMRRSERLQQKACLVREIAFQTRSISDQIPRYSD